MIAFLVNKNSVLPGTLFRFHDGYFSRIKKANALNFNVTAAIENVLKEGVMQQRRGIIPFELWLWNVAHFPEKNGFALNESSVCREAENH